MKRCALLVVSLCLAVAAPAHADGGRTLKVDSAFVDPGFLTGFQTVRCGAGQPGVCEAEFRGHSTTHGTMTGFEDYTLWGHFDPDAKTTVAYAHEKFYGTITGCGTGTFEFILDHATETPDAGNPALMDLHGTWYVLSGSGTGDLARLTGSGKEDGVVYPDTSNTGRITGQVSCR